MSLMENQPRPSSKQKHRSSLPPLATVPFFQDQVPSPRRHHHYHQGRRHSKHRLSNASFTSFNSSSSSLSTRSFNNTFELVFTHLIDALIFTSAIAITAYNYWMGYIADPPRIYGSPSPPKSPSPCVLINPLDIPSPPLSSPSSPTTWSDLKRTPEQSVSSSNKRVPSEDAGPSLPPDDPQEDQPEENQPEEEEEEEERVNRMEETLQELIRQGQAALTS